MTETNGAAETVHPLTRAAWRRWLERHHDRERGVWLITYKQAAGQPRVAYAEAVEEALCFGWIDSKPRKLDEARAMQWFSPRKPRSGWSAANKARVQRLSAAGLMAPAGLAKVQAAKLDGSWTALTAIDVNALPRDLARALAAQGGTARRNFAGFPPSARRAILEWIAAAKRPETRAARVEETARLAARNVRANQWRQPGERR